jgi:hypothetical protein
MARKTSAKKNGGTRRTDSSNAGSSARLQSTEATYTAMKVLEAIAQTIGSPRWFPNGITKIDLTLKVGGAEFSVKIAGPDTPASSPRFLESLVPDLIFTIDQRIGKKARGVLSWPLEGLSSRAVSGDSGHDSINLGTWTGSAFQERPADAPYCDASGNCWFSVFKDAFGRTGMGIHPDGGVADATAGCIGLSDADTKKWHDALKAKAGAITCLVQDAAQLKMSPDDKIVETFATESTPTPLANNSVHLQCKDDKDDSFALNFVVSGNTWTANCPSGTEPIFKTKAGVWQRVANITTLYKQDGKARVGHLTPFVPESAKEGDTGNGKSEETGHTFTWRVELVT